MRRFLTLLAAAAIVGLPVCCGAYAKDLEVLTRFLIPAYLAQNFAALCVDQDRNFLSEMDHGAAMVAAFAEHMKKEITIDLMDSDAAHVQLTAANTARHAARQQVGALSGQQSEIRADVLKRWCDGPGKQYIVQVMRAHQEQHAEFLKRIDEAKR